MNLIKENIHMNEIKQAISAEITLDDDFIVPDNCPDIEDLITNDATITMDGLKFLEGRILLKGSLNFKILYHGGDNFSLISLEDSIPINESIGVDNASDNNCITVKYELDDLSINVINSRKYSVRAIISIIMSRECVYDIETATDVDSDDVYFQKESICITQIAFSGKDIFRIKENITIPDSLPDINKIMWDITRVSNVSTKLLDNELLINGVIDSCVLFKSSNDETVHWYENAIPFSGKLPISGVNDSMIPDINISLASKNINIKADSDGEPRILEFDLALDLNMRIYKECSLNCITDIYSTTSTLTPVTKNVSYNQLIMKNISNCKVNDRLKLDVANGHIMQIIGANGDIAIEEMNTQNDGILVEGVITVYIMAATDNDKNPITIIKEVVPFSHVVKADGVDEDSLVYIRPCLTGLTASMAGSNEIEMKSTATLDTLVLGRLPYTIITDVEVSPKDTEVIKNMPGLIGYKIKKDDTLFGIAKKFYTTTNDIKQINNMSSDKITEGEFLLIVKSV